VESTNIIVSLYLNDPSENSTLDDSKVPRSAHIITPKGEFWQTCGDLHHFYLPFREELVSDARDCAASRKENAHEMVGQLIQ